MAETIKEHGISIAVKRSKKRVFIELTLVGKLTDEDYKTFVPVIDGALKKAKGLEKDILVDMRAFKGWKLAAAWDDFVFGVKYMRAFDRMALIGNKKWEEVSTRFLGYLARGKVKYFKNRDKAVTWLLSK